MLKQLPIYNPATHELIETLECDTEKSIAQKIDRAHGAQAAWAKAPLGERIACIASFSRALEAQRDRLARILTLEVGKPLKQSINEINGARARIAFFVEQSEKCLGTETAFEAAGRLEKIAYEPLGAVAVVSAWNYPYLVGVNAFVPALIAGNAVLYKPSEFSTLTGTNIARLLRESGVPENIFITVVGSGIEGAILARSSKINGLFFTGSVATGRRIRQALADRFIPSGFELGGKDPVYVREDADLAKIVPAIADGVFYNNGQSCCSVERIYVARQIHDAFAEKFVAEVKGYKLGDPMHEETYLGPLTRRAQIDVLLAQVADATAKGANLATGGKAVARSGNYFEPTVLLNVNHSMAVMREESFGPVIGIQAVKDDAEAITLMNDTAYGLTAGVYTPNQESAMRILEQVNAGSAYWNCCDRVSPYLPWSGRQDSGLGSTLSHLGIRAFARPKAYHLISG